MSRPIASNAMLGPDLADRTDAYWRAPRYLSVGQIDPCDKPLCEHGDDRPEIRHWQWTPRNATTSAA